MTPHSRAMIRRYVSINGRDYCCYLKGNCGSERRGDLLFCNGLFNGASSWAYQTRHPELLRQYRMVMFDYPCQGRSAHILEHFSPEQMVDEAVMLAETLDLKHPVLIGHSFGGIVAGLLAAHPHFNRQSASRVRGLVLANTSLRTPRGTNKFFWQIQRRMAAIGRSGDAPEAIIEAVKELFRFFLPLALGDDYLDFIADLEEELLAGYASYNHDPAAVANLLAMLLQRNDDTEYFTGAFRHIDCPVQIVAGVDDRIFPLSYVRELATLLVDARWFELERAGHSVMVEQHKTFNQLLVSFLESLTGEYETHDCTNYGI